jgi:hypothetical protein
MGSEHLLMKEGILCTQERELESLSKYKGFGVYSMNKTRVIYSSSCSAPCQTLLTSLLWGEIPLRLWAQKREQLDQNSTSFRSLVTLCL